MDDILNYNSLYDIYKNLLTDKQRRTFEDYFFENLTIDEIAENYGISKNAVSKTIKQIKLILEETEEKLHIKLYMDSIKNEFSNENDILLRISKYDMILI